jgi:hypothetical protein
MRSGDELIPIHRNIQTHVTLRFVGLLSIAAGNFGQLVLQLTIMRFM